MLQPHQWVILSSWISKVVTAVIQIAVIRLMIERVGVDVYAGVALLTGLAGWYALADFGIGNSLQNHISENRARGLSSDGFICSGLFLAIVALLILTVIQFFAAHWLGPLLLKSVVSISDEERISSFRVFGQISLLGVVGGLVYKIWYATQRGYLANVLPALAALAGYVAVQQVSATESSDMLLWCVIAIVGPAALLPLPFALNQAYKAWRQGGRVSRHNIRELSSRAAMFTGLAFMAAVVLQLDYIVISQFLPAADIVVYSVTMKIFSTAFFVYYSVLQAFWPLLTEYISKGDWPAVRTQVRGLLLRGVGFMVACTICVLLFERQILVLLAPKTSLQISAPVILLVGLYFSVRIWTDTFSTVLSSMSRIGPLLRWVPVQAVISVGLQIYLTPRFGIAGMVIALIAAFLMTVSWVLPRQVSLMWSASETR
jgi:O-antigen/teichoic acid export membrane protein